MPCGMKLPVRLRQHRGSVWVGPPARLWGCGPAVHECARLVVGAQQHMGHQQKQSFCRGSRGSCHEARLPCMPCHVVHDGGASPYHEYGGGTCMRSIHPHTRCLICLAAEYNGFYALNADEVQVRLADQVLRV